MAGVSGRCLLYEAQNIQICDTSNEFEKCNVDSDCKEGAGVCGFGYCSKSEQGGECKVDADCRTEGNICFKKENEMTGTCMNDSFPCIFLAKYRWSLTGLAFFVLLTVGILVFFLGPNVLGQNFVIMGGVTLSVIASIILILFLVFGYHSWFIANCV